MATKRHLRSDRDSSDSDSDTKNVVLIKRARTNDVPRRLENQELPPQLQQLSRHPSPTSIESSPSLPSDIPQDLYHSSSTSQFGVGALILLRLENFQVATDSTFQFEPYLNLVLGANGTGKSAIINAIFLLFLGTMSDLGQSSYSNFVQYGKNYGTVTALVKEKEGQNKVIGMYISAKQTQNRNKLIPQWFIDGSPSTVQNVYNLVYDLNIQVNNLCQFLPQFRVAAFSGETPQQRLESTEQAIGYQGMRDDHILLADTGKRLLNTQDELESLRPEIEMISEKLDELKELQASLQAAQQNKREHEFIERVLDIARYEQLEMEVTHVKELKDEADVALNKFNEECRPYHEKIRHLQLKLDQFKAEKSEIAQQSSNYREAYQKMVENLDILRGKMIDKQNLIKHAITKSNVSREEVNQIENKIGDINDEVTELVGKKQFNDAVYEESLLKLDLRHRELTKAKDDKMKINARINEVDQQKNALQRKIQTLESQLQRHLNLEGHSLSQVRNVIRFDNGAIEHCYKTYLAHKDRFKQEVIAPAVVSVKITDPSMARFFASVAPEQVVVRFICLNSEDQVALNVLLPDQSRLNTRLQPKEHRQKGLFEDKTLCRELGFDGVIGDYISGPEPMIDMFHSLNVMDVPFTRGVVSTEALNRLKTILSTSNRNKLVVLDHTHIHTLEKSRFGRRQISTFSKRLTDHYEYAKHMARPDVSTRQSEIKALIESKNSEMKTIHQKILNLNEQETEASDIISELRNRLGELSHISEEKQIRDLIQKKSNSMKEMEQRLKSAKQKAESFQTNIQNFSKELADLLSSIQHIQTPIPNCITLSQNADYKMEMCTYNIQCTEALIKSFKEAIEHQSIHLKTRIKDLQEEIDAFHARTKEQKLKDKEARIWLKRARKLRDALKKVKESPISDLEADLRRLNAAIRLSNTTENLESVEIQIGEKTARLELLVEKERSQANLLETTQRESAAIRDRYVNGLNQLQSKISERFSEMFREINCRGSVELLQLDLCDVGDWGLDILVAFRQNEAPMKLSRQRQSGGERALTTAFYLMALQDLAHAPFRVLDEINQGMDEQNERDTMRFLVNFTCTNANRPRQCFVVTPKLISNLHTDPRMNVVFIMSGTNVKQSDEAVPSYNSDLRIRELLKLGV